MTDARRHGFSFWWIAFTYLVVMAFSAVPSPLYAIYARRDGLSSFTMTLVYAAYALGVVASLLLAGHVSDWHGRRRVLAPAVALSAVSAVVFLTWTALPALFVGRILDGLSVGVVTATATAYLGELHARHRPRASDRRAQLVATAANLGGIGFGPLVAGLLAQEVSHPLTVPYLVSLVALLLALAGILLTPETRAPAVPRPAYRPQRVGVPHEARARYFAAGLGAGIGFAGFGLFSGLTGTFLAGTLHQPSRALAGASIFVVFASGAAAQALTSRRPVRQGLAAGMSLMLAGLALVVVAAWLPTPSLALFLGGGALTGAGGGALFKGTLATVIAIATEDRRAEALAGLFVAAYAGLSVPIVGVGVALQFASARVALLGFAIVMAVGTAIAAPMLVGTRPGRVRRRPLTAAPAETR